MTLTQLRYLVAVADHCHFGKAAEACTISQPTLSAQLRKLEQELSATLVERGTTIALTAIGEAVVARARLMLSEADEIIGIARRGETPMNGPRRVGIIPTICPYMLPWALPALKADFPRLDLICREAMTDDVLAMIRSRSLDWGIIADDPQDPSLRSEVLFEEPFYAALPLDHARATGNAVDQADLASEKLLVLGEGHCMREQTMSICAMASRAPDDIRATSLETLRGLVAAGHGVTLLPAMARREHEHDIALLPLRPGATRTVYLVARRADQRREELGALAKTLREAMPPVLALGSV